MNLKKAFLILLLFISYVKIGHGQRPHGPERFALYQNTKVQKRQNGQKVYYFDIIDKKQSYGMPKKKPLIDVFSWDTLSRESAMEPWIFRIRNKTNHTIFITDVSCTLKDVFIEKPAEKIKIDTNDYLELIARVNPLKTSHFYCTIEIKYLQPTGTKKMQIHQWGFRSNEYTKNVSQKDSLYFKNEIKKIQNKKNNPIRVYLSDKRFNFHQDLTISGFYNNGRIIYPKLKEVNGEFYAELDLDRNLWDSLTLHVNHATFGTIAKHTIDSKRFNERNVIIFAFPEKWSVPFYYTQSYPSPYNPLPSVYQISYDYVNAKDLKLKGINAYMASKGIKVQANGSGFIFVSGPKEALILDRKLSTLKYDIKLLPVLHYSTLDQNGWGGECSWLTDIIEVRFFKNSTHKERMELLTEFDFIRTRKSFSGNELIYQIRLKRVIDRKFMIKLNALYKKKEVKSIHQQRGEIAGLD